MAKTPAVVTVAVHFRGIPTRSTGYGLAGTGREESSVRYAGHHKKLVSDRGFGFITPETGEELFFHASSVEGAVFDNLREGQQVDFATEQDPRGRGLRAVRVRTL